MFREISCSSLAFQISCNRIAIWLAFCASASAPLLSLSGLAMSRIDSTSSPKPRLKCNPDLGFAQHVEILQEFIDVHKSRDLLKNLQDVADLKWPHAVKLKHIIGFYDLFAIATNKCSGP